MSGNGKGSGKDGLRLLFSCSGAEDTAEIGDRAARKVDREGTAKMSCLVGVGGGVDDILNDARAANRLVVVDGCDNECAAKLLRKAGFDKFMHLRVTDLGFEKGDSPVTDENVDEVAEALSELLGVREA